MRICDLHTHSNFSDGTLSPAQLLQAAEEAGLAAVVLCDHNTVAGLPAFVEAGEKSSVETIPGIEFSVDYGDTELHLIMLFVSPEDYAPITQLLALARQRKEESTKALVQALQQDGFDVDYDQLQANAPDGYINRAHIAAELVRLGHARTMQDAFKKYLAPGGGYYIPPKRPDVFETIRFIRERGGVSVLAHPFLNLDEEALEVFLPQAAACGLDAMETLYSRYDVQTTQKSRELACRFGLLESGGSDFHGENKADIRLGVGKGQLRIPLEILEKLKDRRNGKES